MYHTLTKNTLARFFLTSEVTFSLVRLFLESDLERFFGESLRPLGVSQWSLLRKLYRGHYPDPPFHAFFPKKRGLAEKSAVSLLFCPFLRFFGPKKAPFPCFRFFYPRFFRQNCAFFELPNDLVTTKIARVETTPKKHRKRKKHRKGDQGSAY